MRIEYLRDPTPHAVHSTTRCAGIYAQIRFPDIPPRPMGRIGRDIYFGEPEWAGSMMQPGWAELSSTFMSEGFMRRLIGLFADDVRTHPVAGSTPTKFISCSAQRVGPRPRPNCCPNPTIPMRLFIRFDLQAIDATYDKKGVHCDHLRRVIGGVLFMTSAEDEALEGGEFALYSDLAFNNDRICHQPRLEKTFPFRHNQGVVFLNSNTGFHGPTPIRRMSGMRKWIDYSISSRRNVLESGAGASGRWSRSSGLARL